MQVTHELLMTEQEFAESAQARAAFLAFLNLHFNTLPDAAFVERIRSAEFTSVLEALAADGALPDDGQSAGIRAGASLMREYVRTTREMDAAQLSLALGVDRTRLYRGVSPQYGPPPPNEAVWIAGSESVTATLVEIAELYRQAELQISPDAHARLDYIGIELDFAYKLARREEEAWLAGDHAKALDSLQRQADWLRAHVGKWVPLFIAKAQTMVETDFYRGHMQILEAYLNDEQARLKELLAEAQALISEAPQPPANP